MVSTLLPLPGLQLQLLPAPLCSENLPAAVPILQVGTTLRIGGWVKTGREAGAGAFAFLEINDGSCFDSLQVRQADWKRCCCARQPDQQAACTATVQLLREHY